MKKKQAFVCLHCSKEFDVQLRWCDCCKMHIASRIDDGDTDCIFCRMGITKSGGIKYNKKKPGGKK